MNEILTAEARAKVTPAEAEPSRFGTILGPDTIRFQRLLPGPIERVWAYLTESEKRGTWLAQGTMEPKVGSSFELRFRNDRLSDEPEPEQHRSKSGTHNMTLQVLRCEPPRLLVHSWPQDSGLPSQVTVELEPKGDRVLLTLTHERASAAAMRKISGGWHVHLDFLVDRLEGRRTGTFWGRFEEVSREYEARLDLL